MCETESTHFTHSLVSHISGACVLVNVRKSPFILIVDENDWLCYSVQGSIMIMIEKFVYGAMIYVIQIDKFRSWGDKYNDKRSKT